MSEHDYDDDGELSSEKLEEMAADVQQKSMEFTKFILVRRLDGDIKNEYCL